MSSLYFGGIPIEPEVQTLLNTFGIPEEGRKILYTAIAEVIHCDIGTSRFRTVTTGWRGRLRREHNLYLRAKDGVFEVLTPSGRLELGSAWLRQGGRMFRKSHVVVEATDRGRLTPEEQRRADHLLMATAASIQAARLKARQARPSLPLGVKP